MDVRIELACALSAEVKAQNVHMEASRPEVSAIYKCRKARDFAAYNSQVTPRDSPIILIACHATCNDSWPETISVKSGADARISRVADSALSQAGTRTEGQW